MFLLLPFFGQPPTAHLKGQLSPWQSKSQWTMQKIEFIATHYALAVSHIIFFKKKNIIPDHDENQIFLEPRGNPPPSNFFLFFFPLLFPNKFTNNPILSNTRDSVTKTAMTASNYSLPAVNDQVIALTPWATWGNVVDVAKGAVFLASDDAAWVTGVPLPVDGGYLAQ